MSPHQAKVTIEALANGIDPETGEVLNEQSIFNNPLVIRALFMAIKALDQVAKREERQTSLPANIGKAWSESENKELLAKFDGGLSVKEIAAELGRTKGAITSRLSRSGRLPDRGEPHP
jgi:DNA-directed RNA polymerase specialized sigma24 family protein